MSDLNLIPLQIKIDAERKSKRRLYILLSIVISLVIILITLVPVYLTYKINNENKLVQQEISKLNYVSEQINSLNQQKKEMQDRTKILDSLLKQEIKWTGIISGVSLLIPPTVTIVSLDGGMDNISLQCTSQSRDDIAVFMGKLENSNKFESIKIGEIKTDENTKKYLFDLKMKPKITESKVK